MKVQNIYNGLIIVNNNIINLKEFKIISLEQPKKLFKKVNFPCA